MQKFNANYKKILEQLDGGNFERPGMGTGPNMNFGGVTPSGFKGSGPAGVAPGETTLVKIKINRKKKKTT